MIENPWLPVFKFLKKYFRLLSVVFFAVAILTYAGLRLFITPRYLSESTLYPANIEPVSSEDPTEQALQILNSEAIKTKIIDSFNLAEHYGFGESKLNYSGLSKKYERLINIERTPFSSIEISVSDVSKELAAQIANAHRVLLDRKILQMRREKFIEWSNYSREKYEHKLEDIEKASNTLNDLKKESGILNLEEQSALVSTKHTKVTASFNETKSKIDYYSENKPKGYRDSLVKYEISLNTLRKKKSVLDSQFQMILQVGDKIRGLEENLALERETLAEYKTELEQAEQNARRKITYSFEVSAAEPSDKPHYPKKVISAFITAVSVVLLLMLILAMREQYYLLKSKA